MYVNFLYIVIYLIFFRIFKNLHLSHSLTSNFSSMKDWSDDEEAAEKMFERLVPEV